MREEVILFIQPDREAFFELPQKSIKRMLLQECHLKNVFSMA
jgi:hypothetical protein|tara:strand:- start:2958 stop:3083 length:126 start_codon:yes stop_codon:yes gene_type:complete